MGKGCEYIYCTFLLFWHYGSGGVLHSIVLPLTIQGGACKELVVRGRNHGVGGEVGVAPVIGQYL